MKVIYKTILTKINEEILNAVKNKKEILKIVLSHDEFIEFQKETKYLSTHHYVTFVAFHPGPKYMGVIIEEES